ncbi:LysR family transcriptional regulator [uncultured Ferrovibrio sp.]|jgi:LysR family transcriptional regulator for bpeEF and oprC|uniref:LysR family transcriptional regulator n=1 Tax=uncultured Ferrovibrio sp. TaxID=1576913 RepID=UPI0026268178|nr:LysR family transcriptional regulator [uncultured Ferrovibrio sp.]
MDRFQAMETFTRVVEAGSFKRAAETLRVLPSSVTKTIKDLEAHLGVQLLKRTTRAINVTEAGLRYYDSCKAILREVQAAEGSIIAKGGAVRGAVRVSTTPSLARRFIIPALPRFRTRYPDIDIDLHLGDAVIDLVQEGIDCVIRAGRPQPSSLIVRRLASFHWYVCGSPDYLAQYGEPASIAELRKHLAVGYADSRTGRPIPWTFRNGKEATSVAMKSSVTVNDTDAYIAAGMAGLGLIRAASYMVRQPLSEGRLVRVLADLDAVKDPLSVLYPQSRHLSPAVRTFIDWCIEIIGAEAAEF